MPKLLKNDEMLITIPGGGNFQFSAIRPENLGATEYTLVTMVVDKSSSVEPFDSELVTTIKTIVEACKKSPRAENLMLRFIKFNKNIEEVHGFKLLHTINIDDYGDTLNPYGTTALYDATYSAIGSTLSYAKTLIDQDFDVNGVVYIITDGLNNEGKITPTQIKTWVEKARGLEEIESLITVLIGLNDSACPWTADITKELKYFVGEAKLTQFVEAGSATVQKLAKLAQFVSESISSQSQALGTGGASQLMTF